MRNFFAFAVGFLLAFAVSANGQCTTANCEDVPYGSDENILRRLEELNQRLQLMDERMNAAVGQQNSQEPLSKMPGKAGPATSTCWWWMQLTAVLTTLLSLTCWCYWLCLWCKKRTKTYGPETFLETETKTESQDSFPADRQDKIKENWGDVKQSASSTVFQGLIETLKKLGMTKSREISACNRPMVALSSEPLDRSIV